MATRSKQSASPSAVQVPTVDLVEFKRQKELVIKQASSLVAAKIKEIKVLLEDVRELIEISGIQLNINHELSNHMESIAELHPDWNSSSYDC